jgi:hypothetical protein
MNANEMTFGIEIETHVAAGQVEIGSYYAGRTSHLVGLEGWKLKSDSSIQAPPTRSGCEFVSPVLRGEEGIKSVVRAVAKINELGAKVNGSCGVHIHVGWTGTDEQLDKLISLVARHEKAIFAATGTKSRENGHWCQGVKRYGAKDAAKTASSQCRYHVLNLSNLRTGRTQTVEFRAFSGSTNIVKILGWLRMVLGLVEKAMKSERTATWNAKQTAPTSPVKRSGDGHTELARLFYALGWTKGREKHTFGWVDAEGAADVKETKKEMVRLAKQYDAS